MKRIPSLDGLRAFSIMLVLIDHLFANSPLIHHGPFAGGGYFGVRIFFVISGFLITSLLINEWNKKGRISLRDFYLRWTLRIFPANYVYVAITTGLVMAGLFEATRADLWHAWTYTMNYHPGRAWVVGHLWSLSVEEQFYLLWPGLLCLFGMRSAPWIATAAVALAPLLRVVTVLYFPAQRTLIGESFHTVADALAMGCLLATLRPWLDRSPVYMRLLRSRMFWAVPLTAAAAFFLSEASWKFDYTVGATIMNAAIAVCIDRWVRYPDADPFARGLNLRIPVFIGGLSYSLYLWNQFFFNPQVSGWYFRFPANLILTFVAALISYYFVEQPFLRLRQRFETARQPALRGAAAAAAARG